MKVSITMQPSVSKILDELVKEYKETTGDTQTRSGLISDLIRKAKKEKENGH